MGAKCNTTHALWDESFPPKTQFSVDDMPDLQGKVMIVTGANTGAGRATVKVLLNHGARVYLAARSREKAEKAIQELKRETGQDAIYLELDLANIESVQRAAQEFMAKEEHLHVLFNNAGVFEPPIDQLTADGYDLQFGTNVLGHYHLTLLLMPTLLLTAQSSPQGTVRVITTASINHNFVSGLDFDTFRDGEARRRLGKRRLLLYSQSKFGNIVFAKELARRYGEQGIVSIALNPGNLRTEMQRYMSAAQRKITHWMSYSADMGALTQLYAGTMPEAANLNGQYMKPWARIGKPRPETEDLELGARLWAWMEEQVQDRP